MEELKLKDQNLATLVLMYLPKKSSLGAYHYLSTRELSKDQKEVEMMENEIARRLVRNPDLVFPSTNPRYLLWWEEVKKIVAEKLKKYPNLVTDLETRMAAYETRLENLAKFGPLAANFLNMAWKLLVPESQSTWAYNPRAEGIDFSGRRPDVFFPLIFQEYKFTPEEQEQVMAGWTTHGIFEVSQIAHLPALQILAAHYPVSSYDYDDEYYDDGYDSHWSKPPRKQKDHR